MPFSAERGTEIRPIWMSLCSDSSPTPTVNTGTSSAFKREQRVGERRVGRVGAVGDHHEAGQRQPGELLARALERHAEPGLRAAERQLLRIPEPPRGRREAEGADDELVRRGLHQRRVGPRTARGRRRRASCRPRRRSACCASRRSARRRSSAARPPRGRPAPGGTGRRAPAPSVATRSVVRTSRCRRRRRGRGRAVGEHRRRDGQQHEGRRHVRAGRRHQPEIALLKDDRPIAEEQLEERLEHVSVPAGAPRGADEP